MFIDLNTRDNGAVGAFRSSDGKLLWLAPAWFWVGEEPTSYGREAVVSGAIDLGTPDRVYFNVQQGDGFYQLIGRSVAARVADGRSLWSTVTHALGGCCDWNDLNIKPTLVIADGHTYSEAINRGGYDGMSTQTSTAWNDTVFATKSGTRLRSRNCWNYSWEYCDQDGCDGGGTSGCDDASIDYGVVTADILAAGEGLILYSNGAVETAADGRRVASWSGGGVPALAKGIVYAGIAYKCGLIATDARTGAVLWDRTAANDNGAHGNGTIQPTVANGVVYQGNRAYDARNGKLLWTNAAIVDTLSPIVVNGRLYANTTDGKVAAWGLK